MEARQRRQSPTLYEQRKYPIAEIRDSLLNKVYKHYDSETKGNLEELCSRIERLHNDYTFGTDFIIDLLYRLEYDPMEAVLEDVRREGE